MGVEVEVLLVARNVGAGEILLAGRSSDGATARTSMARRPTRRQVAPGSSPARDHGRWGAPLLRSAGSRGEPIDFVRRGGEEQLPALDPPHFLSGDDSGRGVSAVELLSSPAKSTRARALLWFVPFFRSALPVISPLFAEGPAVEIANTALGRSFAAAFLDFPGR